MRKNICVITTSLGKGGAERSSAILTQLLSLLNVNVYVLVTKDVVDYEFSGALLNLEKKIGKNVSNLKKIITLRAYFKNHNFDVIIDNRARSNFFKEYFLYHHVFKAKRIFTIVHSYCLENYFPQMPVLAKLLFNRNFGFIAVSAEIKKAIEKRYGFKNVFKINNAFDLEEIKNQSEEKYEPLGYEYILWYGRIVEKVKNIRLLLESYMKSSLISNTIKLVIMGEGQDLETTKQRINHMGLENDVVFLHYLKNPYPYVKNAMFTVLTSYHEGFPMALLESLACGTPVVSVDCQSGPKEIVKNEYNGLLVENHNPEDLANAFNRFLDDKMLYETCKSNTITSVERFSLKNIAFKWKSLIE